MSKMYRYFIVLWMLFAVAGGTGCATTRPVQAANHRTAKRKKIARRIANPEQKANSFGQPGDCARFANKMHRKEKTAAIELMAWCMARDDSIDLTTVEQAPWSQQTVDGGKLQTAYLSALMRVAPDRAEKVSVEGAKPCAMVEDLWEVLESKADRKLVVLRGELQSLKPQQMVSMASLVSYRTPTKLKCPRRAARNVPDGYRRTAGERRKGCYVIPWKLKYAKTTKHIDVTFDKSLKQYGSGDKGLIWGELVVDADNGTDVVAEASTDLSDDIDESRDDRQDVEGERITGVKLVNARFLPLTR